MKKTVIILLLLPVLLFAGTTGKLTGKVTDASTGEPLIGVNILLEGTTLGAATDVNGNYTILNIPPGLYSVRISFIGYTTITVNNVRILVDLTTTLPVQLSSSSIAMDEVVVVARNPLVQKDLTSTKSVMSRDEIESLPVSNFLDMLSIQAGVVGSGNNLHIRGGRADEVAYLVDGMYVQDPLLGGLATSINNDAIQEMSLLSGTFNAEYGNALSGVVNIVTRDGGEDFRGKLEVRTSEFGVKDYTDLHELRMNGSLSGPVTQDIRFFLSGEQDKRGSYLPFGYNRQVTGFGKLTFLFIPGLKIALASRYSSGERQNYSHTFKYIPERYAKSETESYHGSLTLTHSVLNNLFYDLKLSYFSQTYFNGWDRDTSIYLAEPFPYLVKVENGREYRDFYAAGNPVGLVDSKTSTIDAKLDLTWQANQTNEIRIGLQYKKHDMKLLDITGIKRPLNLQYIDNYHVTTPYEMAAYIQDKIELPFLVINLGLRADYMNANVDFRNDPLDPTSVVKVRSRSQLSPRVGIAHPISDRTKLHFSYGHFFQNSNYNRLFENKDYKLTVREPIFGQPNLDAERTVAYEVGLTHQFSETVSMSMTAYYKDITGLIGTTYFFPYSAPGRFIGYTLYVNEDYANVKGFEVNVDFRPARNFSGGISYTYSVAKGSSSSEQEQYPGTTESTLLYYLDFDKTHSFNLSATYMFAQGEGPVLFGTPLLENSDISFIFRASSGYPYTPSGRDVGFVVKNSLRLPANYTLDIEIGKELTLWNSLKLRIFAEILNITNHRNILYVYPDTGDPDFTLVGARSKEYMQDPSNYGPPRSIRLGLGIRF